MADFLDIHQHIAYGVDDGADSFETSVRMLEASAKEGVVGVFATPHITPGQDAFDVPLYRQRVAELNAYANNNGLPIRVYTGSEILYTNADATLRALQTGQAFALAIRRHVLLEFLPDDPFGKLEDAARQLSNAGFHPVFAHIERYECLLRDIRQVRTLRDRYGVCVQVNCSSILRNKGMRLRRFVRELLEEDVLDFVATDAHNRTTRPTRMLECYGALVEGYGVERAEALCGERQMEIFSGSDGF